MIRYLILGLFLVAPLTRDLMAGDLMREPWGEGQSGAKLFAVQPTKNEPVIEYLFAFYKYYISPVDGDNRCSFYPSCSSFSLSAFRKHNVLIATLFTFDRLTRCGFDTGRHVIVNRHLVIFDPLSMNDFWLNKSASK